MARKKASRDRLEVDFRVGVIESLPFPAGTFDAVISNLMMHHLPEHVQVKGVTEIRRVLKPGGRLLVADIVRSGTSFFQRFLTPLALHRAVHHLLQHGADDQLSMEDLPEQLERAGFAEIERLEDRFSIIGFVRARKPSA